MLEPEHFARIINQAGTPAPGPGGVCSQAYRATASLSCLLLSRAAKDLARGVAAPSGFNDAYLVSLPKKIGAAGGLVFTRDLKGIRPICLSNSDNKVMAAAAGCRHGVGQRQQR